jgi:hypothetical protein
VGRTIEKTDRPLAVYQSSWFLACFRWEKGVFNAMHFGCRFYYGTELKFCLERYVRKADQFAVFDNSRKALNEEIGDCALEAAKRLAELNPGAARQKKIKLNGSTQIPQ